MSLVNDALKRAKNAQQKTPPTAPGPQLRPAESAPTTPRGMGILLPLIIALLVLLSFLFLWDSRQKTAAREPSAENKPVAPVSPAPETKPPVRTVSTPAPSTVQKPLPLAVAPAPTPSAPEPAPKLQAIFFSPGHSTAIIGGKTVRAGDVVKGFRVAAITQGSATLISATATNVMTLEQ